MSLLKTISSNIIREKEITKKKERQFENNPWSKLFEAPYPVIQQEFHDEKLRKRLAETCRSIGDVQKRQTNARASMTDWWMHETDSDFKKVCDLAIGLAMTNSPTEGPLVPYDCWGVVYNKGDYTISHDHWPQIWSWVYNVECCIDCSPLVIDDCFEGHLNADEILPHEGNMIMFPGWVKHSVPEQECDHERIVIAGNIGANPYHLIKCMEIRGAKNTMNDYKTIAEEPFRVAIEKMNH